MKAALDRSLGLLVQQPVSPSPCPPTEGSPQVSPSPCPLTASPQGSGLGPPGGDICHLHSTLCSHKTDPESACVTENQAAIVSPAPPTGAVVCGVCGVDAGPSPVGLSFCLTVDPSALRTSVLHMDMLRGSSGERNI